MFWGCYTSTSPGDREKILSWTLPRTRAASSFPVMSQKEQVYKPTIESLHKLQDILTRKLGREITLEETELAYHNLMSFAFAMTDMTSDNPSSLSDPHIAALTNDAYTVA